MTIVQQIPGGVLQGNLKIPSSFNTQALAELGGAGGTRASRQPLCLASLCWCGLPAVENSSRESGEGRGGQGRGMNFHVRPRKQSPEQRGERGGMLPRGREQLRVRWGQKISQLPLCDPSDIGAGAFPWDGTAAGMDWSKGQCSPERPKQRSRAE